MTNPTSAPAATTDALAARIATATSSRLITTLRVLDATMSKSANGGTAEERLVRARLIAEVERRFPAAEAAVAAAFDAYDDAIERGEDDAREVDYVAVLLANVA